MKPCALILDRLDHIEQMFLNQKLYQKENLSFNEACLYLGISSSNLYKLTSGKRIPHFCPGGKKLYFNRVDLDNWINSNKRRSIDEIQSAAISYSLKNGRI